MLVLLGIPLLSTVAIAFTRSAVASRQRSSTGLFNDGDATPGAITRWKNTTGRTTSARHS